MASKQLHALEEIDFTFGGSVSDSIHQVDDLSPEILAASLTEADVDELLNSGTYPSVPMMTQKWLLGQQQWSGDNESAPLDGEELSCEVGGQNDGTILSVNHGDANEFSINELFATFTPVTRPNALSMPRKIKNDRNEYITPSVLVSPTSETSTALIAATPVPRRRRRESSCSSDSSSISASSGWTRAAGSKSAVSGSGATVGMKRRRTSSRQRQTQLDKDSEEYRQRRVRNNVAVRKSRDKAKQRQEETSRKVTDLANENENLTRQLESVTQELTLLRSIFANLGVPIQQLVTDALQVATQSLPTARATHSTRVSKTK